MKNDLEGVYGSWSGYGWGAMWFKNENQDHIRMDFDPELLDLQDVKFFYKNRKNILALPLMTRYKFYKTILGWLWSHYVSYPLYWKWLGKLDRVLNKKKYKEIEIKLEQLKEKK